MSRMSRSTVTMLHSQYHPEVPDLSTVQSKEKAIKMRQKKKNDDEPQGKDITFPGEWSASLDSRSEERRCGGQAMRRLQEAMLGLQTREKFGVTEVI